MMPDTSEFFLEVCLSPALLPYFSPEGKTVVLIDIFRASSAICTALQHGVKEIIPVKHLEEAYAYRHKGFIVAAERQGEIVEGFSIGNSPFSFMNPAFAGQSVVLTTTNCTSALEEIGNAYEILIGAFVNLTALVDRLTQTNRDIILVCAGWKNRYNLEDSIFAGALASKLKRQFTMDCDSAQGCIHLYESIKHTLRDFLRKSSHAHRLHHLNIDQDIDYCLTVDLTTVVPSYNGRSIVNIPFLPAQEM